MNRISARDLSQLSMETLWDILQGEFTLVFDDGEIQTDWRATIYSAYAWRFHRQYPETPMLRKHHIDSILKGQRLNAKTHLQLLGNVMFSTHDMLLSKLPQGHNPKEPRRIRDTLTKMVYEQTNEMYNELTYRLEEYVTSIDITDFMNILKNPQVAEANANVIGTQDSIDGTYKAIRHALETDPRLEYNSIALAVRSKLVDMNQVNQCVGPRGFLTDIDSNIFPNAILTGYARGIRSFHDSLIESRSAAKSLIFSKAPLQDAEYFSRRLQLMSQIVQNLHPGDCGSDQYLLWHVRDRTCDERGIVIHNCDLPQIAGKVYLDDDQKLKFIQESDTHLIGRTLKLRAVDKCAHPDPYGICETCFGQLSEAVPDETNIGHMCGTSMTQKSSQSVLSVKHVDGSSVVEGITLDKLDRKYLKVAKDDSSYMLSDALKGKNVKLVIDVERAKNISDIMRVTQVEDLNIGRVSELTEIGFLVDDGHTVDEWSVKVNIGRRLASMTYPLLRHLREHSWAVDPKGNYVVDMSNFDWAEPILTLPLMHINMSDHSKDIAETLESKVSEMHNRDKVVSPHALLAELYDLVNSKLSVNLAVLEVILYATRIKSAEDNDYGLPKPWTKSGIGVMSLSMANRSKGASMAYEDHRKLIVSPESYINDNPPDHPLDVILTPQWADEIGREQGKYTHAYEQHH